MRLSSSGTEKQHNTVETGEVRYVYQPVEALMLVLVTNKHSNIVEDLEMLRLFAKVLNEYCPGEVDEANVCKNAFEIIFAFDEVVALGHRENVTMRDIQVNMEMESHEEKLANMIRQSKEREAAEEAKRRAKTIATERRRGAGQGGGLGAMGGLGSPPLVELTEEVTASRPLPPLDAKVRQPRATRRGHDPPRSIRRGHEAMRP